MIGYSVPRGTGGTGAAPPRNKALKAKARPPWVWGSDLGGIPLEQGGLQWGLQHGTGALIKIPCSILIGWRSLILPSTVRLGSAHRTIPAKIFVENLNCPDLTASFLAGAKDLWRIQKTACLLLPPLLYLGSSGQFPEWLTFDVNDPKVLRGDPKGTPLRFFRALFWLGPKVGTHGLPDFTQDLPLPPSSFTTLL